MIDFGREICGNIELASKREWLVTNGIGGYASGTVSGMLTRRYHGLLVAALKPPLGRTLLLSKLDETVYYAGASYPLFCNHWVSGEIEPDGYNHLERFRLEGTTPVWTFACADALLEKRVWMQPGANITYVQYRYVRPKPSLPSQAAQAMHLNLKALVNCRDYHEITSVNDKLQILVERMEGGLQVSFPSEGRSLYLSSSKGVFTPQRQWYLDFYLSIEAYRGERTVEDHFYAGDFQVMLQPGESLTLAAAPEPVTQVDGERAYAERLTYEREILAAAGRRAVDDRAAVDDLPSAYDRVVSAQGSAALAGQSAELAGLTAIDQLVLAADQFIVKRSSPGEAEGSSVIAGYPWFGDWGRDTMISLPGLALATGRPQVARKILRTFADYVDRGMLPNRFPDAGENPEYNTADASLWYFEAIRAYHAASGDDGLLDELTPVLQDMIAWHMRGTRYKIHCDPQDGLLYAGEPGVQLTWMDAKVNDWVVTPRSGKPVEINALWYNALCCLAEFARRLGKPHEEYQQAAENTRAGFSRFWNEAKGYCFDVLDGPTGNDEALRPNQLLAVSLPHSPLDPARQQSVVEACARSLLTSHGLRSLAPFERGYVRRYEGNRLKRDGAYHQGTVWGWLIGPFVSAHLRVYCDPQAARSYLIPFFHHLCDHGLGSISEIFDGDPPFTPRGCIAQAWSVGEVLRVWEEVNQVIS